VDQLDLVGQEWDMEAGTVDNTLELLVGNNQNHHTEDKTYLQLI
jgi:hypothetical protein